CEPYPPKLRQPIVNLDDKTFLFALALADQKWKTGWVNQAKKKDTKKEGLVDIPNTTGATVVAYTNRKHAIIEGHRSGRGAENCETFEGAVPQDVRKALEKSALQILDSIKQTFDRCVSNRVLAWS